MVRRLVPPGRLLRYLTAASIIRALERSLRDCGSVADVGCGEDSLLQFLRLSGETIGIDAHTPSVEASRSRRIHDRYIVGPVRPLPLTDKSVDAAIALELIEHLPKDDGYLLLQDLERVARKVVIVTTPCGYLPQGPLRGNPYQCHLSGWLPDEFRALGFSVNGILGLSELRGEEARIARRPRVLWWAISQLSEPYVWRRPERAFGLYCSKRLEGPHQIDLNARG